jgi:hypothetical protein
VVETMPMMRDHAYHADHLGATRAGSWSRPPEPTSTTPAPWPTSRISAACLGPASRERDVFEYVSPRLLEAYEQSAQPALDSWIRRNGIGRGLPVNLETALRDYS